MELIERVQTNADWAIYIFIGCFLIVAIVKGVFTRRFNDFLYLPANGKYVKIYKENVSITDRFTFPLTVVQILSYSFFIHLIFSFLGYLQKNNFSDFFKVAAAISAFVLLQFIIEQTIAFVFAIHGVYDRLVFKRSAYKVYSGLILLLTSFILFYTKTPNSHLTIALLTMLLVIYFALHT